MSESLNLPAGTLAHGSILVAEDANNAIRWQAGERLQHLFEARCREIEAGGRGDQPAIDRQGEVTGFLELERRANRMAQALRASGVRPGEKLDEELFLNGEDYRRTKHTKVFATIHDRLFEAEAIEQMVIALVDLTNRLRGRNTTGQLQALVLQSYLQTW